MAKLCHFFLLICFVVIIPTLHANVKEDDAYWQRKTELLDPYWKEKAAVAEKLNQEAYSTDPYALTSNLTYSVSELIVGEQKGRRNLGGKKSGECMATNPIDRCWRCDPNWANNRKKLADCVQGFGRNTVGGKNGPFYVVTDPSDNDMVNPVPGTLRHAVTRNGPLWIIFARSMKIRLNQELIMTSDKTIDGRGVDVYIVSGAGITIQFIKNVIIHGIKIFDIVIGTGGLIRDAEDHYGIRTQSDGDGISIFGSSNIWIDHVSMRNCRDGLIDAVQGSTAITISNSHFTNHNEVMLFGASDSYDGDKIMQITLAFNHFGKKLIQRMPRCRYGFVHVVNNDYTHWEMYAIGGSKHPTIISEGNRFIASNNKNAKEITKREYTPGSEWKSWQWRSLNDAYLNGAFFVEGGPVLTDRPFSRKDMMTARPASYVRRLTRNAGSLRCTVGKPC
ncbi:pectate lyase 3 [Spatholobus suberectus]|nr:pectate lyase 3 [Spatholobus suberectus]